MAGDGELARAGSVGPLGVVPPVEVLIECGAFSGTLGALFHLVREHRVDLLGVPLGPVCEAYLRYVLEAGEVDMDRAGAALAALAYLVERKAWHLLPAPEGEEPEVEDLLAVPEPWVHEFAPAIEALAQLAEERSKVFFRTGDGSPYGLPFEAGSVSPVDLAQVIGKVLARANPKPPDVLRGPARSLAEEMERVMGGFGGERRTLEALLPAGFTRTDALWAFLALLELIRIGRVLARLEEGRVLFARRGGH